MGGPLDLGEVDAFLDHLVERGELAEVLDDGDDLVGDVVDFCLGVEAAEAEADGGVGDVVAEAEGPWPPWSRAHAREMDESCCASADDGAAVDWAGIVSGQMGRRVCSSLSASGNR